METTVVIIFAILLASIVPFLIAALLYWPLRHLSGRGFFKERWTFIVAHLGLSLLVPILLLVMQWWSIESCSPEARYCNDIGASMIFLWLWIVLGVTAIISPIIANTMYVRLPD